MTDERLTIPQEPKYFQAVGLAVIAFARLEWEAAWCCERIAEGYIASIEPDRKTAGRIATDFVSLAKSIPDEDLSIKIASAAIVFKKITDDRNGLLHGKPGSAATGEQLLFGSGHPWTIALVNNFADRCAIAAKPLNALLQAELKSTYIPTT